MVNISQYLGKNQFSYKLVMIVTVNVVSRGLKL